VEGRLSRCLKDGVGLLEGERERESGGLDSGGVQERLLLLKARARGQGSLLLGRSEVVGERLDLLLLEEEVGMTTMTTTMERNGTLVGSEGSFFSFLFPYLSLSLSLSLLLSRSSPRSKEDARLIILSIMCD
jgi:hypothetical protein